MYSAQQREFQFRHHESAVVEQHPLKENSTSMESE